MELSTKTVCIVGPRRLHNEVLADFIRTRLGAASHLSTEIRLEIPQGALLLIDCLGSDRDTVLEKLRSLPSLVERGLLPALFNLNQGLGIEKAALDTGVRGLFFADDSAETLLKGIAVLLGGEFWVARRILSEYLLSREPAHALSPEDRSPLTFREQEVLRMLAHGASNDQIGCRMCISIHTVKTHVYNIFRKIHVSSRLEAALWTARQA